MGTVIAFFFGLAGTFTACNAGFSALAALSFGRRSGCGDRLRGLSWLTASACVVAGTYGAVGALIGDRLPQLSTKSVGEFPMRLVQSSVAFSLIDAVLIALGVMALSVVASPLKRLSARYARTPLVVMGALIGAFLAARSFPLFHKMLTYAASAQDPFLGTLAFMLQTLGNVLVLALLFPITAGKKQRLQRWLLARPDRLARLSGGVLLVAGVFALSYWAFRVPSVFGFGWWPTIP